MAIIKHIASKNADYGAAERYLTYKHDEFTNKPILDANGRMIPRDEYIINGINCSPDTFAIECIRLNKNCNKNTTRNEIKSHHYILSFDPRDRDENGLTAEKAQAIGMEFAKKNFPGHQAIVCTHTDGHNGSGNIHVHMVINSLRMLDVERQDFMERPCDSLAGNKHHVTKDFMNYLKQETMNVCQREQLYQVDLLSPAKIKVTEREYWQKRRKQKKIDVENTGSQTSGNRDTNSKYETTKDKLRIAITACMTDAHSMDEFKDLLIQRYGIILKESRGRFSYLHPERTKPITSRMLGTDFEKEFIERYIASHQEERTQKGQQRTNAKSSKAHTTINPDTPRLIVDLQNCIKAQQNPYYARKVKIGNLKEMAKTVAYLQERGINSVDELQSILTETKDKYSSTHASLKDTECRLKTVNKMIHYTGQYFANKGVYDAYRKSKNKAAFLTEHRTEIALFEAARGQLSSMNENGKLPSIKALKSEKENLTASKNQLYEEYSILKARMRELETVQKNIDAMLHPQEHEQQQEHDAKREEELN
jgi:hypothetical protein